MTAVFFGSRYFGLSFIQLTPKRFLNRNFMFSQPTFQLRTFDCPFRSPYFIGTSRNLPWRQASILISPENGQLLSVRFIFFKRHLRNTHMPDWLSLKFVKKRTLAVVVINQFPKR